jgi:hypothetical protein
MNANSLKKQNIFRKNVFDAISKLKTLIHGKYVFTVIIFF